MTSIGLMSDTHGFFDASVLEYFKDCDEVWHAGDIGDLDMQTYLPKTKTFRAVYGNIDGGEIRQMWPLDDRFKCEDVDVWMTHIGGYPGKYSLRVREQMEANPPDLFICGHSHILKVMRDKKYDLIHMNPGACGNHGFHKMKTILRFKINGSKILDVEAIELGKRGAI